MFNYKRPIDKPNGLMRLRPDVLSVDKLHCAPVKGIFQMGVIRSAIKDFDPAQKVADEQKALLGALDSMASIKLLQMKAEIENELLGAGTGPNLTIPVVAIEVSNGETHASTSDGLNTAISKTVTDSTKQFIDGGTANIVSGITNLITSALEIFLGSGAASSGTLQKYYVAMSGVALWRVDLRAWYYQVEGSGISTKVERVSAFYYTRSTVNVEKLPFQTFLNEYEAVAQKAIPAPKPADLLEEIKTLRTLYNELKQNNLNMLAAPLF